MACVASRLVLAFLLSACSDFTTARDQSWKRGQPAAAPGDKEAEVSRSSAPRPNASESASLEILKKALRSQDYATRLIAVEAAGELKMPQSVEWLAVALGDPEHDVRMAAVMALASQHTHRAGDLLRSVRDDETEQLDIRALASTALLTRNATSEGGSR